MAYNGSVEVVSGLKQKNNADFPIVEASAVYVADGKNLADIISGIEEINIKEYLDNNNQSQQSVMDSYGTRISTIENTVGTISGDKTIAQKLTEIDNEIGLNTSADNSLKNRVTSLETVVGNTSEELTTETVAAIVEETARSIEAEDTLSYRIDYLEGLPVVMSVSNDTKYATHLNTITDSTGNVLAYFDTEGNFHVNGNIYSENW